MLHAWRKPRIAPAATNRSEPSSDMVNSFSLRVPIGIQLVPQVAWIFGYLSQGAQVGETSSRKGAHAGIHEMDVILSHAPSASRIQVIRHPRSAASPSARA